MTGSTAWTLAIAYATLERDRDISPFRQLPQYLDNSSENRSPANTLYGRIYPYQYICLPPTGFIVSLFLESLLVCPMLPCRLTGWDHCVSQLLRLELFSSKYPVNVTEDTTLDGCEPNKGAGEESTLRRWVTVLDDKRMQVMTGYLGIMHKNAYLHRRSQKGTNTHTCTHTPIASRLLWLHQSSRLLPVNGHYEKGGVRPSKRSRSTETCCQWQTLPSRLSWWPFFAHIAQDYATSTTHPLTRLHIMLHNNKTAKQADTCYM